MKKAVAALTVLALLALCFAACGQEIAGGWTVEDTEITPALHAVFDQAMEELVGVNYIPEAYLGRQVVNGTNHCFLCKATVVYPGAQPYWALVYIHVSLDGRASLLKIDALPLSIDGPIPENED